MTKDRDRKTTVRAAMKPSGRRYTVEARRAAAARCAVCGIQDCSLHRPPCADGCTVVDEWENGPSCRRCHNALCLYCLSSPTPASLGCCSACAHAQEARYLDDVRTGRFPAPVDVVRLAMNEYGHLGDWAAPDDRADLYYRACRDSALGKALGYAHAKRQRCTDGCVPWPGAEAGEPTAHVGMCDRCMRPLCAQCRATPVEWEGICEECVTPVNCDCYVPPCGACSEGLPDDCECPTHAPDCQFG